MTVPNGPADAGATVSLVPLLRRLLSAGGPSEWPANVPWPLHQAVAERHEVLCPGVLPVPSAGIGWWVPGLDDAVVELAREGHLTLTEAGFTNWWVSTAIRPDGDRRELMRCDPSLAQVTYEAARRWAALSATSANTLRKASASVSSRSLSAIPIRRHLSVPRC